MDKWMTFEINNGNELKLDLMWKLYELKWFNLVCMGSKDETARFTVVPKGKAVEMLMKVVFKEVKVVFQDNLYRL